MKLSKKAITALSFAVGACVFVSTAFADMALGTGYDRLKNSVKHTAAQMENGLGNYTIESLLTLKADGKLMTQASIVQKIDTVKRASEDTTTTQELNGETTTHYAYSDPELSVWKSAASDTYFVTEKPYGGNRNVFSNPFDQEGAPEIEKIVDALVGNLKDYVQAEETSEGGRIYSGSLSEAQVPALVNAVSSFALKQMIRDASRMDEDAKLPEIETDIFVKKVSGTAFESKAGLLENLTGEVTLSGKDRNGVSHDLTLSVVFKLSDIGNTKVEKPDLTNAKIEKSVVSRGGFDSKYAGTYKNNIIIEKDGKFVKIGERTLEITSVEERKVTGKYYETVKPEYAAEYPAPYNFAFEFDPNSSMPMNFFTYTNAEGEQKNGQLHPMGPGKLYIELDVEIIDEGRTFRSHGQPYFDGEMIRVFEE